MPNAIRPLRQVRLKVRGATFANDAPVSFIAGLCALESEEMLMRVGRALKICCARAGAGFVFKSSVDKANRTSLDAFRGLGFEQGLRILARVAKRLGVAVDILPSDGYDDLIG